MKSDKFLTFLEAMRDAEHNDLIDTLIEGFEYIYNFNDPYIDYIYQFRDPEDPNPNARSPEYKIETPPFNMDTSNIPQYPVLSEPEKLIMDELKKKFKCSGDEIFIDWMGNHITKTPLQYLSYMQGLGADEWQPDGYYDDVWHMFYGSVDPKHKNDKEEINNRTKSKREHKSYD